MSTNGTYTNTGFINDDGKSNSKETNFEKAERFSYGLKEKGTTNGYSANTEYDPYAHRKVEHPLTNNETIIHLLKSALGTGIFAMPNAFNHSGYLVGLIGTIILGSIATYCVHLLVNIHYDLCKWKKVPSMSYPLVGEAALLSGPKPLNKYAPYMIHVINAFLLLYQIGACCIYVVFIATNIKALVDHAFEVNIEVRLMMAIILLPLIFINWIRNLKYLAPLSTIGNCVTIASFGVICYYIFREPLTLDGKRVAGTISEFPMFFGTVLFALEAIGVIMPLENEMKTPADFRGSTGILNRSMFLIVSLYIGLGLCGYLKYGPDVKSSVTLNLPETELLAQCSKAMIAFGVFITHGVACYVAIDIAWNQYFVKQCANSPRKLLWEYTVRTTIVFITFVLAIAIPNLELFISLIGALALSTLGILFPAFLECCTRWNTTYGLGKAFMIVKCILIGCIGLAGFIIGTTLSVKDIINEYF